MAEAIIYESNTGFTKKYALLLSSKTGLPCFSLEEAENALKKGYKVVFMGWLRAGKIVGLKKAQSRFDVVAVAGVGMAPQGEEALENLKKQNELGSLPAFYLRGGLEMAKLHGINKVMLQFAIKVINRKQLDRPESKETLDMIQNGRDYTSVENLRELIDWCGK